MLPGNVESIPSYRFRNFSDFELPLIIDALDRERRQIQSSIDGTSIKEIREELEAQIEAVVEMHNAANNESARRMREESE